MMTICQCCWEALRPHHKCSIRQGVRVCVSAISLGSQATQLQSFGRKEGVGTGGRRCKGCFRHDDDLGLLYLLGIVKPGRDAALPSRPVSTASTAVTLQASIERNLNAGSTTAASLHAQAGYDQGEKTPSNSS